MHYGDPWLKPQTSKFHKPINSRITGRGTTPAATIKPFHPSAAKRASISIGGGDIMAKA